MRWDDMKGDARRRFCEHCQLHVQNLSAMSNREAAAVVMRSERERVCVSYVARSDGTMVTRTDFLRERLTAPFQRVFSWLLAAVAPLALGACSTPAETRQPAAGGIGPRYHSSETGKPAKEQHRQVIVGGI